MSLHIELADMVDRLFADRLQAPAQHRQDALIVQLDNDVTLTIRYAAADAYSLRWSFGGRELGIDTAPLHRDVATFPNHLHAASGRVLPDPVTRLELAPADNLQRVIRALLEDPTLGTRPAP